MQKLYEDFRERAAVYLIYVAEAHPSDEWQLDSNEEDKVLLEQPTTYEERIGIAKEMLGALSLDLPTLVDEMDNAAAIAFSAWPERLYVIDKAGKVVYMGGPGPGGFVPDAARRALHTLL